MVVLLVLQCINHCPYVNPTNHIALLNSSVYLVTATTATWCATSIWQTRLISWTFSLDWSFKYNLVQMLLFLAPFQKLREGKRRKRSRKGRRKKKAGTWRVNSKKYNSLGSLIIYCVIYKNTHIKDFLLFILSVSFRKLGLISPYSICSKKKISLVMILDIKTMIFTILKKSFPIFNMAFQQQCHSFPPCCQMKFFLFCFVFYCFYIILLLVISFSC